MEPIESTDDAQNAPNRLQAADWVNAYLQSPAAQRVAWEDIQRRMVMEGLLQAPQNYYMPAEPFFRPGQITVAPGTIEAHPYGGYALTPRNDDAAILNRAALNALTGARTMPIRFTDGLVTEPVVTREQARYEQLQAMDTAHRQINDGYVYAREFFNQYQGEWPAQAEAGRPDGWCGRDNCRTPRCAGSGFGCGEIQLGRITVRMPNAEELAERQKRREEANARAEGLLLERLTEEQRATWLSDNYIEVTGSKSKNTYRIKRGKSMNIECPKAHSVFCAAPENYMETPEADVVLAQMLWLTCDEPGFLKKANVSPLFNQERANRYQYGGDRYGPNIVTHAVNPTPMAYWLGLGADFGYTEFAPNLTPELRQAPTNRANVEAWVPDACANAGCQIELLREDNRWAPRIVVHHRDARDDSDGVPYSVTFSLERGREWPAREIKRALEGRLHTLRYEQERRRDRG